MIESPRPSSSLPASHGKKLRIDQQKHMVWLVIFSGAIVLSFLLNVVGTESVSIGGVTLPEVCTLKRLTGWNCPGCGLTRSFISMADTEWQAAWQFHPAGPLWFFVFAIQVPYRIWQLVRLRNGQPEFRFRGEWILSAVLLSTLLVAWAFRLIV